MAKTLGIIRHAFKLYPVTSNSLFYGGVWMTAESTKQYVFHNLLPKRLRSPYEVENVAAVGLLGTCVTGPALYHWYKWLDIRYVGTAKAIVLRKCLLDRLIMSPYTWVIMIYVWYMTSKPPPGQMDVPEEAKEYLMKYIFCQGICFWLPAQAVNFMYVQPHQRMVYIGGCTLVWICLRMAAAVAHYG